MLVHATKRSSILRHSPGWRLPKRWRREVFFPFLTERPFTTDGRFTPEKALAKKNLPSSRKPTVRQRPITGTYYFKFVDSRTLVFPGASPCLPAGGRASSGVRRLVGALLRARPCRLPSGSGPSPLRRTAFGALRVPGAKCCIS